MPKMKMEVPNLDGIIKQLEELGGDVKAATEEALKETHRIVTEKIEAAMVPANMPAGGKYWTGDTLDYLRTQAVITWQGTQASVPVGFEITKGGINSIFLMYGTPRMSPVKGLRDAVFGKETQAEVVEAQTRILHDAVYKALMG